MDQLPPDVLHILSQWVRDVSGQGTLANLARTFKNVSQVANNILYLHVVLSNDAVTGYVAYDRSKDATRSLTLSLEPGDRPPPGPFGFPPRTAADIESGKLDAASDELSTALNGLRGVLPQLSRLESFSLYMTARDKPAPTFALLRSDIAGLVAALPDSVLALEVDTRCIEQLDKGAADADVICHAISKTLPQLQHLRLRTQCLSARLIAPNTHLSRLKTVRLNWCCGQSIEIPGISPYDQSAILDAKAELVTAYRETLARDEAALIPECRANILDFDTKPSPDDPLDFSAYHMFRDVSLTSRQDATAAPVVVYPVSDEWSQLGHWWARTRTHDHIIGTRAELQQVIEQPGWYTATFGARCAPDTGELLPLQLHVMDREAWKAKMGNKIHKLWSNEDNTGQKLLSVEERETYEDRRPPRWTVPLGWIDEAGSFRRM